MFQRRYMEYHAHRFKDASLLFYHKQKLLALLPAHLDGQVLASHKGLTFGGILCDVSMTFALMQEVFSALKKYLRANNVTSVFYKAIPTCYHQIPASEDVAVLTVLRAKIVARDLVSVVDLTTPIKYYKGVRWGIQKARKAGLEIRKTNDVASFLQIMAGVLAGKYGLQTAHTAEELKMLLGAFPEQISLVCVFEGKQMLGGTLLFLTKRVVHAQYIGMSERGKELAATPFLLDSIFQFYRGKKQSFSFGTSQGGEYVNEKLLYFKESMGARALLQEQYLLHFD